jgi:hypothetical protein
MAELKTKKTGQSVEEFLNQLPDEKKRKDCFTLVEMMEQSTGAEAKMWGSSIVGFGDYRYKYESGRSNDWFIVGFSPRKQNLTLYLNGGLDRWQDILSRMGRYKKGNACLYINKIEDVNLPVLRELIDLSVQYTLAQK